MSTSPLSDLKASKSLYGNWNEIKWTETTTINKTQVNLSISLEFANYEFNEQDWD